MGSLKERLQRPPLPEPLTLELAGGAGLPLLATVKGEVDYTGAFSMQVRIATACRRRRARGLIVDLSGAQLLSSSGLGAIINLQREPACLRGGLVLARPSREARRVLELTGMDQRLTVADTVEEAEQLLLYSAHGADVTPGPRHRD
jgi:anti-sigma B factor antagonist